jgi:threonine/homoserine/homoserine lactone efflux protein
MFEASIPAAYFVALAAVYVLPGPDMALVMGMSAVNGTRAGLCCTGGIAAARFLHVMASGLGMAALLSSQPGLLRAVCWTGGGYLAWLGWKLWRAAPGEERQEARIASPWAATLRGFLTNLLNPKALLFCGLLLPQFVSHEQGPLLPQFAWLGVFLVLTGCLFDVAYVVTACGLSRHFRLSTRIGRARNRVMGSFFLALAARIVAG